MEITKCILFHVSDIQIFKIIMLKTAEVYSGATGCGICIETHINKIKYGKGGKFK
jgi:hypothetical protein